MEQRRQSLMTWSLAWLNFPYCTLTTLTVLKWFVDKEWIHTLSPWDRYILECAQTDKKTHCDTYSIEDKDCGSSGHANLREACYDSSNLSLSTNEEDKTLASSHFNSLAYCIIRKQRQTAFHFSHLLCRCTDLFVQAPVTMFMITYFISM